MAGANSNIAGDLASRGIAWQAIGFAIVGIAIITIKHVYSGSDAWQYELFVFGVGNVYWAFALIIAYAIDRSRKLFETKAQIRAEALQKSFNKGQKEGQKEGRKEEKERIESLLVKYRSEIPPDLFDELTKSVKNGRE